MKKSGLFLCLALLLSCPLLAQEKTYDPIFDKPIFMHPGFDLGQVAPESWKPESWNYQSYGPEGYGSEAEGHRSLVALNYQRYGRYDCGSEALDP